MALASAPSTPQRGAAPFPFQRSFTAPARSYKTNLPAQEASIQGAETLYAHPAGKIVSFDSNASKLNRRHSSISDTKSDFQDNPSGSLPWASVTERTIAAGPLQIYRVMGSVAFLSSGTTLQPLLAKSQCWCVDGVSKFVLRIRPNTYYRIELPHESRQDEEKVAELKKVLPRILQYEVTSCPFKRGFTVDLPKPPETPIQKKPWRPRLPAQTSRQDDVEEMSQLDEVEEEASKEKYPEDIGVFLAPPNETTPMPTEPEENSDTGSTSITSEVPHPHVPEQVERINQSSEGSVFDASPDLKTPKRPKSLRTWRTITAPPQLSLRTSPPSTSEAESFPAPLDLDRQLSVSSSIESFHSFHSPISPLPASPTSSNSSPEQWTEELSYAKTRRGHTRDMSDVTVTAIEPRQQRWDLADDESADTPRPELPRTPTQPIESSWSESIEVGPTPTPKQVRLRRARRRPRSPLPSSTNLYSPYSPGGGHLSSGHHLTTAILQRTCSLLLGPPIQLVALMLRIAAKIAKGAFSGSVCGVGHEGQRIPCSWDFSSDGSGDDDEGIPAGIASSTAANMAKGDEEDEEEEEDDYGFSLGKTVSGKDFRGMEVGGSWEID